MKKVPYLQLIIILVFLSINGIAQTDTVRTTLVSGTPQYLINKGLRIDVEKRLKNPRHWIQLVPQLYVDVKGIDARDYDSGYEKEYDKMYGVGLEVNHKMFLKEYSRPMGSYVSYGMNYQHFGIQFKGAEWEPALVDGMQQFVYTEKDAKQSIDKIGANLVVGYQNEFVDYVYWDIFIGLGFRCSFYNSESAETRHLDYYLWDYGYSGTLLTGGFKLGVLF